MLKETAIARQIQIIRLALDQLEDLISEGQPFSNNEQPEIVNADEGACTHPEDKRIHMSTMGVTRWKCSGCGFGYEKRVGA